MTNDVQLNRNSVKLSAVLGLRAGRLIFSRYQVDIELLDIDEIIAGRIILENTIDFRLAEKSIFYDIQRGEGNVPPGFILGKTIVNILYLPSEYLSIDFENSVELRALAFASRGEFGTLTVYRGDVRFLLPLI